MATIRIIDFETTGMEPPAEVVEVGWCDLGNANGQWVVGEPDSFLCGVKEIPPEVRAIHHISLEEIGDAPPFDAARFVSSTMALDVYAAHNWDFEAKWIGEALAPIPALCTYKAALRVWPAAPSHSNGALRYWLQDQGLIGPVHAKTMPPHRAGPDAYVTAWILKALLETGATGKEMVAWTRQPALLPTCPIGEPWRGKKWSEVDSGFLYWMVRKPVEPDLVWNAQRELDRREGR